MSRVGIRVSLVAAAALAASLGAGRAEANGASHVKSHEHQVERGGVQLALYEKWSAGDENKWRTNGKVILLVHGATWSSRCTFDPAENYSLMDSLANAGYDVFALDFHGYGKSGKTDRDWTEAASAAEDIDAAADYIRAFRWIEKVHVFGYQWGSQAAGLFAMKHPNKVGRLVLFGLHTSAGTNNEPTTAYRNNGASSAMMKPEDGDLDPEFVRKRAQVCVASDPQSPNGALRDLAKPSTVDPAKVKAPTLIIMGDRGEDANAMTDRLEFDKTLASHNKWMVMLPGLGKYAPVERGHAKFDTALISFLDNQPPSAAPPAQ